MPTVLIPGGTGLIGKYLSSLLAQKGYEVIHLSRTRNLEATFPAYHWDIEKGYIEKEALDKADYIINLAGAAIADKAWTKSRKKLIVSSRADSANLMKKYIEQMDNPPKAYISASAIGFYGDRKDELVDENSSPGKSGFLPASVIAWENSIAHVAAADIRTVVIRVGIVLSTEGGALEKMLIPTQFFANTYFGNGRQWYSWIHIEDLCRIFIQAIEEEDMEGVYNAVAPNPIRNKELAKTLDKALDKNTILLPAPAFPLRVAMGEMADVVLTSTKVSSKKLEQTGFEYKFPHLLPALEDLLEREI